MCFQTVEVLLFPNGGPANDTAAGLLLEVKLSAGEEGLYDIYDHAARAFFGAGPKADRSFPVDVYTEEGVLLVNTSSVTDGQMLFLVPTLPQVFPPEAGRSLHEPFVWPSVRVGHRIHMSGTVRFARAHSCFRRDAHAGTQDWPVRPAARFGDAGSGAAHLHHRRLSL